MKKYCEHCNPARATKQEAKRQKKQIEEAEVANRLEETVQRLVREQLEENKKLLEIEAKRLIEAERLAGFIKQGTSATDTAVIKFAPVTTDNTFTLLPHGGELIFGSGVLGSAYTMISGVSTIPCFSLDQNNVSWTLKNGTTGTIDSNGFTITTPGTLIAQLSGSGVGTQLGLRGQTQSAVYLDEPQQRYESS